MFLAADNFKKAENAMQKNIGIFLPVMVFILCGFEHCVANMFYFTVAQAWSEKAVVYLLVMSLGNSVGAFIFPLCEKVFKKAE
jgi:formate/nitrite transporter FocA (FNT family)